MSNKLRALLKISGETLSGCGEFGITRPPLEFMTNEILDACNTFNLALAIVIGGGNIIRGADLKKNVFEEDTIIADHMGMLATLINCIGFKKFLKQRGIESRVMSALHCNSVCEPYYIEVALSHLEKGKIVILAGGMGIPNLSTDMTMVMRAKELEMASVLKGTKVDGIFEEDPKRNPDAKFIPKISYEDYLRRDLKVINFNAVGEARQHGMRIKVFNFFKEGNLRRVLADGDDIGSVIEAA